jgi:Putative peptidoglycan binding domain
MRRAIHLSLSLLITAVSGVCSIQSGATLPPTKSAGKSHSQTKPHKSVVRTSSTVRSSSPSVKAHSSSNSTRAASSKSRRLPKGKTSRRDKGQTAPTPDRISEIQTALAKDGSFAGPPNGEWDDSTVDGMRKFQSAHGLNPTGKLDALTLQKLGLGSQTAGIAPPVPPISSSSTGASAPQTARRQ